jgi:predicted permease
LKADFAPDWKKQAFVGGGSVLVLGLVLFVACANVAQLRLAQAEARRRELGVRFALGAGTWQVVRQLLLESCLVGLAGGALGVLLAHGLMVKLTQFAAFALPSYLDFGLRLDHRALLFALAATMIAVLITGLAPARQAARVDVAEALKAEQGSTGARTGWKKQFLVVGQVAVSVVFFGVAMLSLESLWNTLAIRPGLDPAKPLFIMNVSRGMRIGGRTWGSQAAQRLSALPGVRATAFARRIPLAGSGGGGTLRVEIPGQAPLGVHYNSVSPNYFAVMGTRILAGRAFDANDRDGAPPVMLASRGFARQVSGTGNPLGQWIQVDGKPRQIVGITEDGPSNNVHEDPEPYLYVPYLQLSTGDLALIVETVQDPASLAAAIRHELREFDPRAVIYDAGTLRHHMAVALAPDWAIAALANGLGAIGILLAGAGLFGVLQYRVNRRTREFGLRIALGASTQGIQRMVLRDALRVAAWGVPPGLAMLAGMAAYLHSIVPLAAPFHPAPYVTGALAAVAIALAAAWLPARRATQADPVAALRAE